MDTKKTFYSKEKIKVECQIVDYLANHGYEPVKKHGSEWLYSSIGANERTPSFFVNIKKNVYTDYSGNSEATGEKGDIIRLVMFLENCSFVDACCKLSNSEFMPLNFTPPVPPDEEEGKKKIEIIKVQSLRSWSLINYLESRQIGFKLADLYLKEVHYIAKDKKYYSLGFKNDNGGYALRNQLFKNQTEPQGFTTIEGENVGFVNIFEGFFSFLSSLEFYSRSRLNNITYVLNSLSNLNKLIVSLPENTKQINVFFDNDQSGKKALLKLKNIGAWHILDQSPLYEGYKDFNVKLCSR